METFWYRLTQVHLEKWPLKWTERETEREILVAYITFQKHKPQVSIRRLLREHMYVTQWLSKHNAIITIIYYYYYYTN